MTQVVERILAVVGETGMIADRQAMEPFSIDQRRRYFGKPLAVVRPASAQETAAVVRLCAEARIAIVPQGGNTGLVGGATPDASGGQIVLSTARMDRVRALDSVNNTLTAEAGCILANVQRAAQDAGRLFPLSLAAEGSARIGGNLSTNAGGTAVLRYGNARDLVLGVEVVLASGEIWDGLRSLRKDNTGYDLKQLFIGAEGTLGVITAAVLKLFPLPKAALVALAAVENPAQALELLALAQARCADALTGFELFSDACLSLVLRYFPGTVAPFRERHPQYVLVELCDRESAAHAQTALEGLLGEGAEHGIVRDAVVAQSLQQARALWALRENISEAQAREGPNAKHDVSLPISRIAEFVGATDAALEREYPGVRLVTFGHLGDGNLHYNLAPPEGVAHDEFLRKAEAFNHIVHDSVARFGGSISAEHGLGQAKREEILRYKSPVEIDLMRKVKQALDPLGIMNPGKVI
ncbi:MAG: FAD-binding oxidoreductase [Betaproteobacteria bacterium]|nr:FAD-binding oxidoreductase [Betaproteobacteria bacterium]